MTSIKSTITIHMVSSLDGIIAKRDNSIAWFETTDSYPGGVDYGDTEEFLKIIDCYVMGSKTYELALELSKEHGWAYGAKPTFVLTNRKLQTDIPGVKLLSGDLTTVVNDQLRATYRNIWVVGGAALTRNFIRLKLADEIRVSILPIILGEGLAFFDHIGQEYPLHLKESKAYKNGMVELCYEIKK